MTSIPQNPTGSKPAREIRDGEMSIKGEKVHQEKGLKNIERENLRKNKREKIVIVE